MEELPRTMVQKIWNAILDFFSGSGTTGHAVMQMNSEDGGTRSWIQVQLPEPTPDESAARAEGFLTISALARKRLELAAEEISLQDSDLFSSKEGPLDLGFRAYSLVDSHFSKWHLNSEISPTLLEQHLLDLRDDNSRTTNSDELLTEILLKQGYSLNEKIGEIEVSGLKVKTIGENVVFALLDAGTKPSLEQLRTVLEKKPVRIIVLEDTLDADDELKTNLVQECKSRNVELWTA
jgi:adenine-specific DNA-methyltransferase